MSSTGEQTQRNTNSVAPRRIQPSDSRGAAKATGKSKMPPRKTWLWFVLVLLANFLLVRLLVPGPEAPVTVPYTLFKEEVRKRNVEAIYSRGETITGRFKAPVTYPPAGEKKRAVQTARPAVPASLRGAARRARTGEYLRDHAALLRRPGSGSIFDRTRGRDQRRADPRERKPLVDASFRLWPGPAVHRFLRLDVPARGAAGRRHGRRAHGHRQEQGAPLRPGEGHESHLRRRRRHRRSRERAGRDRGFPPRSQEVHAPGRDRSERRAACRRARHRENPARESGRGRSGSAVLLDERARSSSR